MNAPPRGAWTHAQTPQRGGYSPAIALRHTLLWASRQERIKRVITTAPGTRSLVSRFVAGESADDAVAAARRLRSQGLAFTLDHLGEDTRDRAAADATVAAYTLLIRRLDSEGLTAGADVSVKLSALGQAFDQSLALDNARAICAAACAAGTTVTIDMEDHTTTDMTLRQVTELRRDFPTTGTVLQASLRRSEADCRAMGFAGSRIRLCKGAYQETAAVAYQRSDEVRSAFVRCLRVLIAGGAYPMVATHDPRLIAAAVRMLTELAPHERHEFQMLYGIRPDEQLRLAREGRTVRVYIPYGTQWYGYLMRRMAERPANLALVLRAMTSRR